MLGQQLCISKLGLEDKRAIQGMTTDESFQQGFNPVTYLFISTNNLLSSYHLQAAILNPVKT